MAVRKPFRPQAPRQAASTAALWPVGLRWIASIAAVSGVTLLFRLMPLKVHTATLEAAYLLVILALASALRFPETLAAVVAAVLELNFFFLPPVGTLTIADPQNWVALAAFLLTAAMGSRLSLRGRERAEAAERRMRQAAQLHEFGRALLLAPQRELEVEIERRLVTGFGYDEARVLNAMAAEAVPSMPHGGGAMRCLPLTLGGQRVGELCLEGRPLPAEMEAAVSRMAAMAMERARVEREIERIRLLEQSERLKSALLDSVTHELRTPLTSIRGAATALLASAELDEAAQRDLLQVIDADCDRLNELLESLVEMASLEAGATPLHLETASAEAVVEAAVAAARFDPKRLHTHLDAGLPPLRIDARLVARALLQLLKNAAAYSPPGTPIELRVEPAVIGSRWRVSNSLDPEVGAPVDPESLFEKFRRGPWAARRNPGGLGMGLAIARAIIRAHGGEIGIERETLASMGSISFVFHLPVAAPAGITSAGTRAKHMG